MSRASLFNIVTFLSAFLLFQLELIIAKVLLPNYGGSYMVWGACMVFFQAVLFAGYLFSHVMIRKWGMPRYRAINLVLLFLPLVFFPGRPLHIAMPNTGIPLSLDVFIQLLINIGPVFFTLSTLGVVSQVWLSSTNLPERKNPYALYGWSNLGSFAGLLTYPFIVERYLPVSQQLTIWKIAYVALCALVVILTLRVNVSAAALQDNAQEVRMPRSAALRVLLLSAAGVIMFLSVTNIMTMEITPIPLLWVLPLAIYLAAFVLNFKHHPYCPAWITDKIHMTIGLGVLLFFLLIHASLPITVGLLVLLAYLFVVCMYCQRQIFQLKPADDRQLTYFYLVVAFGGMLGGLVTSWVVPLITTLLLEFLVGLIVVSLAVLDPGEESPHKGLLSRLILYYVLVLFLWPVIFREYHFWAILYLVLLTLVVFGRIVKCRNAVTLLLIVVAILSPYLEMVWVNKYFLFKRRNYYGVYKVFRDQGLMFLHHGTILHGSQMLGPEEQKEPTSYYGHRSPVGQVLLSGQWPIKRAGAVGLGAGTIAAYFSQGQDLDFYEIDPDVVQISANYFRYTANSKARIRYVIGDARLSLENRPPEGYDLLVVDAFSGDSVPAHLLTREMLAVYRKHLAPDGVLLVHTSNRYVKLNEVAGRTAAASGAKYCYQVAKDTKFFEAYSEWIAITWSDASFEKLTGTLGWQIKAQDSRLNVWTDDHTSVFAYFKSNNLINLLKNFTPFYW